MMTSDDALFADANIAEIARLHTKIKGLRAELEQKDRCILAERRAREIAESDNGAYVEALQWLYDDWNGPSTESLTRARMALVADQPGAALLAELDAARAVVEILKNGRIHGHCALCGRMEDQEHTPTCAIGLYDAAVKAKEQ